jgi:hypothetical protein
MQRLVICFAVAISAFTASYASPARAQFEAAERGENEAEPEPEERELETDRDAFTPAVTTAGTGLTIIETSYSFIDNRRVAETHSFPELLLRHGISERIELRIGWNYEVGGTGDIVSGDETSEPIEGDGLERESQMLYGTKIALTEQLDWHPESCVILQGFTPTSGPAPATDVVVAYVYGWKLANNWRLDSSIRYGTEHDRADAFNQWAPSVILRFPVTEQWNIHAEYFGIYSEGKENEVGSAFFSPGTHYLITPNLELGVRIGWGLTDDSPHFFANTGIGWRF